MNPLPSEKLSHHKAGTLPRVSFDGRPMPYAAAAGIPLPAEMPFVGFHQGRQLGPLAPGAEIDVAELVALSADPADIVKGPGGQGAHAGDGLQREAEIATATDAEFYIEPAAGLVGGVAVARNLRAGHLHLTHVEHHFRAEGGAGPALAPQAMADGHAQRLAGRREPVRAADASAAMRLRHPAQRF